MQHALGQVRMPARPAQEGMMPVPAVATAKEIPYDYVARFTLKGIRGNRVQDVINISVEGAFVAVAIGYSFIPARLDLSQPVGTISIPFFTLAFATIRPTPPDPRVILECLLVRLCGIDFKYSIVDSGTGRELQNQPIHNIAGLGESTGDRPFRPLAKPMLFLPRSTIRVEIEEISEGSIYGYDEENSTGQKTGNRIGAELFIVLHGYKALGYGTALP